LLVETGSADVLFPVAAAVDTVAQLRDVYRLLGAPEDAVVHDIFDGDHGWHGEHVGAFLDQRLERT
jgi:hypothetical protein